MSVKEIIKKYFSKYSKEKLKCKVCGATADVVNYEICEKETDKLLIKGDFCPTCIVLTASRAREATFLF